MTKLNKINKPKVVGKRDQNWASEYFPKLYFSPIFIKVVVFEINDGILLSENINKVKNCPNSKYSNSLLIATVTLPRWVLFS